GGTRRARELSPIHQPVAPRCRRKSGRRDDGGERLLADEEMLAALGYEPVGFTCVGDALAACRATPKRFDAAVVGHLLSAPSPLDLAAALRAIVPNMPILLATASVD